MPSEDKYPLQSELIQGQSHYYSVFFRGNGESVVSFRAQFTNKGENSLSNINYFIPSTILIKNIRIYQRVNHYQNPCYPTIYRPVPLESVEENENRIQPGEPFPTVTPDQPSIDEINPESTTAPCLDQQIYYGNNSDYLKADFKLDGNVLRIALPQPVTLSESVNLIINYRSSSFTKEVFIGSYAYKFETLRTNDEIENIQIGISAEQDYFLKGAKGLIRYRDKTQELMPPEVSGSTNLYNREFDTYYNRIGEGTIYKYASHLAPMESYNVSGSYADSLWKLYLRHLISGVMILIVIILLILIIYKKIIKFSRTATDKKEIPGKSSVLKMSENQKSLLFSTLASMASATLVVVYTLLVYLFFNFVDGYIKFYNGLDIIIIILILVLSLIIYSAFVFLPSILIGIKRKVIWGITTFILTICWLILYLMLVLVLGFFLSSRFDMDYPVGTGRDQSVILNRS